MDISVASTDAKFGFTEVRVGVAPAMISVLCLPKMRRADASAAFLRGNRFSASEAVRLGLINLAVPPAQLDAEIDSITGDLLAGGPSALATCKQLLAAVPENALQGRSGLDGLRCQPICFSGDEAAEGMAAFLGKRPSPLGTPLR